MRKMRNDKYVEILILLVTSVIIYFISTMQVKNMMTIWNQNDEFGVWQGAAWILGLDWSEVSSTNGFYGQGYGYLLAPIMYFWGRDSIKMTHIAIYFQAFYHTSIIFIAYYCLNKMFPQLDTIKKIIISCLSILTIPDLFYVYMFFSENLLRFLVWCIVGLVVSYVYNERWYKLFFINAISIYAFSVHQRCILLVGLAVLFFIFESIRHIMFDSAKLHTIINIFIIVFVTLAAYVIVYKFAQKSYIESFYCASKEGVGSNLLSERKTTIKAIFEYIFNINSLWIMFQQLCGCIYYLSAYDCGFALCGFASVFGMVLVYKREMLTTKKMPYIYILFLVLGAIMLTVIQNSQYGISERVEVNHYGRYFSYTLGPVVMLGVTFLLTHTYKILKKIITYIITVYILVGLITCFAINRYNVTSLFAFPNACPGIKSVYFTNGPGTATLYHTLLGVVWITVPALIILYASRKENYRNTILVCLFCCIAATWIVIGNREAKEQYDAQKQYVIDTYDLQKEIANKKEIVVFKSYKYGSGLIQYNNPFTKIYVCDNLAALDEKKNGMYVVSQNGIDEMEDIMSRYTVIYKNERYFVWIFES